jgi:hypothetical protein
MQHLNASGTPVLYIESTVLIKQHVAVTPMTITRVSYRKSTIQIIQPTKCNSFTSLLLDVYMWLNMFRASPRPSSGAYNCTRSLWFYRWREAAGAMLVVVWQTTTNNVRIMMHGLAKVKCKNTFNIQIILQKCMIQKLGVSFGVL